ncbi:MAG: hypothetical protein WCI21_06530 [Alphaproteobacteria bacterium]
MRQSILLPAMLAAAFSTVVIARAADEATAPRPGKYTCMGYNGVSFGMFRWYLTIDGHTYKQTKPDLAAGAYTFNPTTKILTFTSGPYVANNFLGKFSVEREGKTHKIILRDKAKEAQGPRVGEYSNFYCNNSTDNPPPP